MCDLIWKTHIYSMKQNTTNVALTTCQPYSRCQRYKETLVHWTQEFSLAGETNQ